MLMAILPWATSTCTMVGMWFVGNKNKLGWLINLASQVLWLTYIISVREWGLMPLNIFMWWVIIRNYILWSRDDKKKGKKKEEI